MSASLRSAPLALIMAGGTGGHVFPALALARELRARSWQVVWLGTHRGLEARLVPQEQIPLEWLSISGLRGKGILVWLSAPLKLTRAVAQALAVIRRRRPVLVVGLGGFVAGPGGLAAWLLRKPLLIHEQNAIAGFTNRCLAHLARRVLEAYRGRVREVAAGEVLPGVTVVPAPGHTPGHSGWLVASGGESLLIWGDVVHMPGVQFARPGAGMGFDIDGAQAIATRLRLMDMAATDRLLVAGMHLDFPAFGHVARAGESYAFIPEVWMP